MVVQLPDDALAAAVGVQIYSIFCLLCSSLMIFLVIKHQERGSCEIRLSLDSREDTLSTRADYGYT
jgi:hypothetical protein